MSLLQQGVNGYKAEGHLLIARIANDKLQSQGASDALIQAEKVLQTFKLKHPNMTVKESKHPFVECATMADDIKYKGGSWQSPWHFVDQLWTDDHLNASAMGKGQSYTAPEKLENMNREKVDLENDARGSVQEIGITHFLSDYSTQTQETYSTTSSDSESYSDKIKVSDLNLTIVLRILIKFLKGQSTHQSIIPRVSDKNPDYHEIEVFVIQKILSKFENNEQLAQSFALRLLIHFMGDIHQPLHCSSRISEPDFPQGDLGGNWFNLPNHYGADDLHAVWDSVLYEYHKPMKLPFDDESWNNLELIVMNLTDRFHINESEYNNINVEKWAQESFNVAHDIYEGAIINEKLSDTYIEKNKVISERLIVIGGLRLATVIKHIYGSKSLNQQEYLQQENADINQRPSHFLD